MQVAGYGGKAPSLPRVGGNEGVGVVVEAGKDSKLTAGDYVVVSQPGVGTCCPAGIRAAVQLQCYGSTDTMACSSHSLSVVRSISTLTFVFLSHPHHLTLAGTWSTHVVAPADALTKLAAGAAPPGSASLPVESAAVAVAAPLTATALLSTVPLAEGDVVVQNDGGSIVGQAVVQAAAARGLRTVNILPGRPGDWAEVVYHLQGLGATLVVDEAFARTPAFAKLLADLPPPKLGIDAAGGSAAASVARALGSNATLVTYGGRPRSPLRLSSALFTAKGLTLKGLSPATAVAGVGSKNERDAAVRAAVDDVRGGDGESRAHATSSIADHTTTYASLPPLHDECCAALRPHTPLTRASRPAGVPAASRVKLLIAREPFADFDVALQRSLDDAGDRTVVVTMPTA